jgi:hypothetical protein
MKKTSRVSLGLFVAFTTLFAAEARAQQDTAIQDTSSFDASFDALMGDSSATSDAATKEHSYGLLPNRMGPMESFMWSEKGLMRKTFDMPLTREQREKELGFRRTMLGLHQIGGFVTLAALIGTVALGQMTYNGNESMGDLHGAMAVTAITSYFTTATLAIFTPPPAIRRGEWSTVSTHKLLATVHFTGMMLTPLLGSMIEDNRDVRTLHLVSGYTTTATFAAALLVVTF